MADLEEMIFKENVPGMYSRWTGESSDRRGEENSDDGEDFDEDDEGEEFLPPGGPDASADVTQRVLDADIPEDLRSALLAERERGPHTGAKAVLADHRMHRSLQRIERESAQSERERLLRRMATGAKRESDGNHVVTHTALDEDEESDEEDAEFFREFRAKRMQELQSLKQATGSHTHSHTVERCFGSLREISAPELARETESVPRDVVVVVHLYERALPVCVRMNSFLEELAATHTHVKFLCLHASDNEIEIDPLTLPILTVYKGGESVEVFAGIAVDFGPHFKREEVEWLLGPYIGAAQRP